MTTRALRVAALVKQIPEIELMAMGGDGRLRRDGVPLHMNDYCRRAVAQGRELARATGGTLTVVTLGPPSAENVLREAIAFGADEGVLATDPAFAGSDTLATARTLAAALAVAGPFDLVLAGRNSLDADTGQVPAQVAALLGLPFAAGARELRLDGQTLRLGLEHDDEWVDAEVEVPAVVSCAERLISPCKIKDPAALAAVDGTGIRRLTAASLGPGPWGQAASPTSVGAVRAIEVPRARRVVPASEAAAVLAALVQRGADVFERRSAAPPASPRPAGAMARETIVAVEPGRARLTRELLGAAAALAAQAGGRVIAFGPDPGDASELAGWGADEVVIADGARIEEDVAACLATWCRGREVAPWAVLGPGTQWGREVLGRASAELGAGLTGDAVALTVTGGRLVAAKPAFGGLCVADVYASSATQMVTVRAGVLPLPGPRDATAIPVTTVPAAPVSRLRVLHRKRTDDSGDLATAEVVIGVGAGVAPEDYPLLRDLARLMGAALAATRKVTDSGWMPRSRQVGITGHSAAPRLYLALGTSGKFNHMAGVRAAGTIVAVNIDPQAPVFGFADLGIVGDWRQVLPLLAASPALRKGYLAK
jgi:electron transfer flavoprotein alpha subunit